MEKEYFLGLDIGTNSVGYAVTDTEYSVKKFNGKAMWGVQVFEEGKQAADRRGFRSARRRLDRRQQRITLLQELMANEISKVDVNFYKRLSESALYPKDKETKSDYTLFNNIAYTDIEYHKDFPTIHHLIIALMKWNIKYDIRLIYLACAYILGHRGHFLNTADKNNIENVLDFKVVYNDLLNWFINLEVDVPWSCDTLKFSEILKKKLPVSKKEKELNDLLFNGNKSVDEENYIVSKSYLIKLLIGGKTDLSKLFKNEQYKELEKKSICLNDSEFDNDVNCISPNLNDGDSDLLWEAKKIFDWSLLSDLLGEQKENEALSISNSKVKIYDKHKEDLALLKKIIKKYMPNKYIEVFKTADNSKKSNKRIVPNYVAYSGNIKSLAVGNAFDLEKCNIDEFSGYILNILKNINPDKEDKQMFDNIIDRLQEKNFLTKQVSNANRVIPYQLYWVELKTILGKASIDYPFLLEKDEYGTVKDKILSIMEFRIPYYVGVLNNNKYNSAWIERKAEGKIYPWNFDEMVDHEKSEEAFIDRMVGNCTYLAGEKVLPKSSLLYSKFMVLNEINKIKIDRVPITIQDKQQIFNDLFVDKKSNVSQKSIRDWFKSNKGIHVKEVSGIDVLIKSSLKSYHQFKNLLISGSLNENDVETIINRITITTDEKRFKEWLKDKYSKLSNDDIVYISNMKYSDYGRLSYKFLCEFDTQNINKTIIEMLWETNYNLMELLSDEFDFKEQVEIYTENYYSEHGHTIADILDKMYISNAVKRPIYRTLDIVNEIKHIQKKDPKKIFVEMARGEEAKKRTVSRKDKLLELYKALDRSKYGDLIDNLNKESEDRLKSKKIYLYYMQLGKCMYTNQQIHIEELVDDKMYNIDHIYPQARVKDDSFDNMVLVTSKSNGEKGDDYPVKEEIRNSMRAFWNMLADKELISKEKLFRLSRHTGFSPEELSGFINRQLVETRQSTKAVAVLLKQLFPNSEIVYVKAGLVSEFRQAFDLIKCRDINDLHHAKDAYLNIVMGNIYHTRFTTSPINFINENVKNTKYTLKLTAKDGQGLLSRDIERNGCIAWRGDGSSIKKVVSTMNKNNVNYVRYSFCRKGGLFNQNINKAPNKDNELIPIKNDLDTNIYGGYNNTTASFFTLVKHTIKGKSAISIVPVDLLVAEKYKNDDKFAIQYCKEKLKLENAELIKNRKLIKINTLVEIDGFRANIASKSNGGKTIVLSSSIPLILNRNYEKYIQKLSSVVSKAKENKSQLIVKSYQDITTEKNIQLYDALINKGTISMFKNVSIIIKIQKTMIGNKNEFEKSTLEKQVFTLLQLISLFKTGRTTGCDLKDIGSSGQAGVITTNSKITGSNYKSFRIIDQSNTGLFEKVSDNLLEL
jgi:CRISPR-associated endonuclease Csn1